MTSSHALIELLRRHQPADDAERSNIAQTLKFLAAAADPLDRNNFHPGHAVASALITDPDRRHVMLVMHAKLHRWLQPGGHAESGETDLLAVARREVLEEVGCRLEPGTGIFCDIDVHVVPPRKSEPQHLHFDFRYLFQIPVAETHPASDALEARWFTLDEALALHLDDGLRRLIGKLQS